MDLASKVMTELSAIDLNGASITNIEYLTNETRIAFVIEGIEVFFTARNEVEYAITSIVYQGQEFVDPDVLSQYDAWVKHVLSKVYSIVESNRFKAAEVAYRANIETLQPEEHAVVGTGKNISIERLEEAEARGRKEGFKAARKTNANDMRALKKKYNIIISVTFVLLIVVFVAISIFMRPELREKISIPFTQQQAEAENENMIPVDAIDTESTESELINDANNTEENNEEAAAELVAALVELEETFEFDNLEITLGTDIAWDVIENEFFELNGAAVFSLPITVTNLSERTRKFDMFSYIQFSPTGEKLVSISSFFVDNAIDWSDDISPNETVEAYMYFLFDDNGEYVIEFDNSSERIKIVFDIQQ